MAGLLETPGQFPVQQPEKPLAPGQAGSQTKDPKRTAKMFLLNGIKLVHDQRITQSIISEVRRTKDPVSAIVNALSLIIEKLQSSGKASGQEVSFRDSVSLANVLMAEILEILKAAGEKELDKKERYKAFSMFVKQLLGDSVTKNRDILAAEKRSSVVPPEAQPPGTQGPPPARPQPQMGGM